MEWDHGPFMWLVGNRMHLNMGPMPALQMVVLAYQWMYRVLYFKNATTSTTTTSNMLTGRFRFTPMFTVLMLLVSNKNLATKLIKVNESAFNTLVHRIRLWYCGWWWQTLNLCVCVKEGGTRRKPASCHWMKWQQGQSTMEMNEFAGMKKGIRTKMRGAAGETLENGTVHGKDHIEQSALKMDGWSSGCTEWRSAYIAWGQVLSVLPLFLSPHFQF